MYKTERRRRVARAFATSLVATGISVTALVAPASAAAVRPQFSGCGWTPANNSNIAANFDAQGVNIRSGADTSCTIYGEGYTNQSVTLRCLWYNSGTGWWWDYITDNATGVKGWSRDDYISVPNTVAVKPC